ncbi:MAG: hypothetical protein ACOCSN_03200 [Halanaeroarchaeum sp.]
MGRDRRGTGTDPIGAAVEVLNGFGVGVAAVANRWSVDDPGDDPAPAEAVRAALRANDGPEAPAVLVRTTIAKGPRGIDAPAKYWDSALGLQLGSVFADVGATVEITDAEGVPIDESATAPEPFRIEITDAEGVTHGVTFAYPETPIGSDNYAAVVHALQRDLLDGTGFSLVSLTAPDRRWRFALVATADLERLQERYGDRISIGDHQVLADRHPAAYVPAGGDGEVYVPSWVDRPDDGDDFPSLSVPDDREPPTTETDVDAILDGLDPDAIAAGNVDAGMEVATDGGVVVEDFDAFVADLASAEPVTPESPRTPDWPAATDPNGAPDAGAMAVEPATGGSPGEDGTDDDEGLDAVFDWIEREVARETADSTGRGDAYENAEDVLAAEVFGSMNAPDDNPGVAEHAISAKTADETGFDWVDSDRLESRG